MSVSEEEIENLEIFKVDPILKEFQNHFAYRWKSYVEQKTLIEQHEGGLAQFSKGFISNLVSTETGSTYFLLLAAQADDYLKTSCQTHAGFIENSMTGLPLTLKNIIGREQIFQVRRDAYAGGASLTTFVINKIFDCALGGNTRNVTANASVKQGATSSVSTISEGKKMTSTPAIKEKGKRVYKEVPDVPMGSNKRKLVLADEDTDEVSNN